MAVRALPRIPVRAAALPLTVLVLALVPSALDLLGRVQPGLIGALALPLLAAAGVAAALLLLMWLRSPRTNWLAAAALTACAAFALRLAGADVAQALSLLTLVALGVGGGFANPEVSPASA